MKKVLLIMAAVLMITTSGNCQWVQRKYGVTDINLLTKDQLNYALRKAKVGTWSGAAFSFIGTVFIFSGIELPSYGDRTGTQAQEGRFFKNFNLITGSALELVGLIKLFNNCPRLKTIKKSLKNKEISFGLTDYSTNNTFNNTNIFSVPVISVKINF